VCAAPVPLRSECGLQWLRRGPATVKRFSYGDASPVVRLHHYTRPGGREPGLPLARRQYGVIRKVGLVHLTIPEALAKCLADNWLRSTSLQSIHTRTWLRDVSEVSRSELLHMLLLLRLLLLLLLLLPVVVPPLPILLLLVIMIIFIIITITILLLQYYGCCY
jgi:hypothetical protein